ncbi:MAG: MoaD/ThiS family protein [Pseudomonadota bacterium]
MKIRVEFADSLTQFTDGAEHVDIEIAEGASPHAVLDALGVPTDAGYLLIVNESVIAKANRETHVLTDGDTLEILPPLKGG